MISTLVLDLDGTLLDIRHRHYQCYRDILISHGVDPIPMLSYWEMKRNRVNRRQLLALSNAVDLYDAFLADWLKRIEMKEYLALDQLQNRVEEIMGDWKRARVRLLLATLRTHPDNLQWQLGELGIAHLLDEVIMVEWRRESGADKAAGVVPFLNQARLDEVVWIGDTEADIHAARLLGVKVCALGCGMRSEAYLSSLSPDMMEPDLHAFATGKGQA